jgi:chromosomal replication initiation ATPase DnaA
MPQPPLPFPVTPSYRREDFIPSASNAEARAWVERWPEWGDALLNLHGAAGSGKTHLGQIWRARSGAGFLDSTQIGVVPPRTLLAEHASWMVDSVQNITDETAWFHLLNTAREEKKFLLILGRVPLSRIPVRLPDLASRLSALPAVALHAPDDALLAAVLAKHFADMQLNVAPEVTAYLLRRMERSFATAATLAHRLNHLSLMEKKNITLHLARKILGNT